MFQPSVRSIAALIVCLHVCVLGPSFAFGESGKAKDSGQAAESAKKLAPESGGSMHPPKPDELKNLRSVIVKYQTAKSSVMDVAKILKMELLNEVRESKGKLWMSSGRMRMELEGTEKTLLVVNLKKLWAVTHPPADFKDAPVQVITGDVNTKKGQSQAMIGLLSQGGLLKFFQPTGAQVLASGETKFFLQPRKSQTDFKRAELVIATDNKSISELRYWDERNNETHFKFSNTEFGQKLDEKIFTYTPPANAEVMTL